MSFAERLKEIRIKNSLKQQDIADTLGITRTCYTNYEAGQRFPNQEMLIKLSDFLKVSLDYLVKGEQVQSLDAIIKPIPVINELQLDENTFKKMNCMRLALLPTCEPDKYFFYKVDSAGMCNVRIDKGDMLMFYKQENIEDENICLALVDLKEYILGKLKTVGDLILIKPLNPKHNIFVFNKSDVRTGKVKILGKALTGEYIINLPDQTADHNAEPQGDSY
jgi:transcriptional regulator with XRE-family HTH domain